MARKNSRRRGGRPPAAGVVLTVLDSGRPLRPQLEAAVSSCGCGCSVDDLLDLASDVGAPGRSTRSGSWL